LEALIPQEFDLKEANQQDLNRLSGLVQKESFVHRHLGWQPPLAWLGKQPYLVLESGGNLISALACPPDEDGITWIRLFAVAPGFSINRSWNALWPPAREWLKDNTAVQRVNCLVIQDPLLHLLLKSGFTQEYRVVVLEWDITTARWLDIDHDIKIREMDSDDIPRLYEIDQMAFEPIWRNTIEQLTIAYSEAVFSRIAELNARVVGYQISTRNPRGGHLARLAVDPDFQNKKVGSALVADVLDQFQRKGIVQVSVNTQLKNKASLELYQKFGFQQLEEVYPVLQHRLS
jgi:ribosomal-protein-alanine N-acetyltransferase